MYATNRFNCALINGSIMS